MVTTQQETKLEITIEQPIYGNNYNKGYIGFTYDGSFIAKGIVHFTRWAKMSDIYASHALIVTGENSCIEADASSNCVREGTLDRYFGENKCQIFFRKPNGLNDEIAHRIVSIIQPELGKEYDFKSILIQTLSGTFLGYLLDRLLQGKIEEILAILLNDPNKWICSELAAYALDEQPEYKNKGILKRPNATISPQELFEDSEIFEPWEDRKVIDCSGNSNNC